MRSQHVGVVRLKRRLTSQRLHYNLTVMALSDSGLVSDPHANVDITVHDASLSDAPGGLRRPVFAQRLYQMNISEDALSSASVGIVSVTQSQYCILKFDAYKLLFFSYFKKLKFLKCCVYKSTIFALTH